jgi:hypothetical protein
MFTTGVSAGTVVTGTRRITAIALNRGILKFYRCVFHSYCVFVFDNYAKIMGEGGLAVL